jgi:hypothetical protein
VRHGGRSTPAVSNPKFRLPAPGDVNHPQLAARPGLSPIRLKTIYYRSKILLDEVLLCMRQKLDTVAAAPADRK